MATIPRIFFERFGRTGPTDDYAVFGSKRAGDPTKTKDIAEIQSLEAWLLGLKDAILSSNRAAYLEDMNSLFLVFGYMLAYILQDGVADWDTQTEYRIGSIVKKPGTAELYASRIDANTGNALPSQQTDTNWEFLGTKLTGYRRPNLVWNSVTTVDVEAQSGTANTTQVMFPDGSVRTVTENLATTQKYRRFNITLTSEFTTGTESGGLRSGLSETAATWYSLYAVKSQIDDTKFVIVGDTTLPLAANFATLNSRYTTNGWLYLGMIRNGCGYDVSSSGGSAALGSTAGLDIMAFEQAGSRFKFKAYSTHLITANGGPGDVYTVDGSLLLGTGSGTTGINNVAVWTYTAGVGTRDIPDHIKNVDIKVTAYGDGSPAFGLVYFGSVSDDISAQSGELTVALLRDTLAVLSATSDPMERSAIVASYYLQLAFYRARLSIKGPNSATQRMAVWGLEEWRAADGIKMFSSNTDSANFADDIRAGVLLKGWEDPVLAALNNAI